MCADNLRDFQTDLIQNQKLDSHDAFLNSLDIFSSVTDITGQILKLRDKVCIRKSDNARCFIECKTDSRGYTTRNMAIEIASNIPYVPPARLVTHVNGGKRYSPITPYNKEAYAICVSLYNGFPKKEEHIRYRSIAIDKNLEEEHFLSYCFTNPSGNDYEFFLTVHIRQLQEQIKHWIENKQIPFCLGHTASRGREWWALNALVNVTLAETANLFQAVR